MKAPQDRTNKTPSSRLVGERKPNASARAIKFYPNLPPPADFSCIVCAGVLMPATTLLAQKCFPENHRVSWAM